MAYDDDAQVAMTGVPPGIPERYSGIAIMSWAISNTINGHARGDKETYDLERAIDCLNAGRIVEW